MFKGAKAKFRTDDMRCKIVGIDDSYDGSHWCVERWWTKEERIILNIEDSLPDMTITDFASLMADVSSSLLSAQEALLEIDKKNRPKIS